MHITLTRHALDTIIAALDQAAGADDTSFAQFHEYLRIQRVLEAIPHSAPTPFHLVDQRTAVARATLGLAEPEARA